jgi:hypothetical protein
MRKYVGEVTAWPLSCGKSSVGRLRRLAAHAGELMKRVGLGATRELLGNPQQERTKPFLSGG